MNASPFVSHALNHEDVVIWRALGHLAHGRYFDTDEAAPADHSLTRGLHERGWSKAGDDHAGEPPQLHLAAVTLEGTETAPLDRADLHSSRPWVLVVQELAPHTDLKHPSDWESAVLAAGYQRCLFNGVSHIYVAEEHVDALCDALSYPACTRDDYTTIQQVRADEALQHAQATLETAREETVHWRTAALGRWAERTATVNAATNEEIDRLRTELDAIRATVSWRATAPLRLGRTLAARSRRR